MKSLLVGSQSGNLNHGSLNEYAALAHASIKHGAYRDVTEKEPDTSKKNLLILSALVIGLHLVGFWTYLHTPSKSYIQPKKTEVLITLAKPPEPPPVVEPPPPPPPPPPKAKQPPPPPKAAPPALRTPPADTNISPSDMVVKENTEAPKTTGPVEANVPAQPPAPPAPPPPAPKEEPLVEAFGGIGYLNNPAPEYPAAADRQGWEGVVQLRVKVLPDGTAGDIEVKKSSGHKLLDDTAVKAVKGWKFSPARRGSKTVEGLVNLSLDFRRS